MQNTADFYLFLPKYCKYFFSEYGRHLFKSASTQNGAILVCINEKKTLQDFDFKVHLIHFKILRTFHLFVGGTPK